MELDLLRGKLAAAAEKYYSREQAQVCTPRCFAGSPEPLKVTPVRGYSIVTDGEGHILRDAAGVFARRQRSGILDKGRLQCTVEDSDVDRTEF
jgi:hypothetical protein